MTFTCISPCKLNLFLYITGKRDDGYHNLQTLFTILDYGDEMTFSTRNDNKVNIEGNFDCDINDNLIFKAITLLKDLSKKDFGIDIKVLKKLKTGGGLGGGSSNAATTLLVLNKILNLNIDQKTLLLRSRVLGADVPVFVNGTSAFAEGIGDILSPKKLEEKYYLVICPDIHASTKEIFAAKDLKRDSVIRTFDELSTLPYHNDFTKTVINLHSKIGQILQELVKYGPAEMSGSGSSLFVEFDNFEEAKKVKEKLLPLVGFSFIAKNTNISPVLDKLNAI